MLIEARHKSGSHGDYWERSDWKEIAPGTKIEDLNMSHFSIRINKDNQYHNLDTPGFKEAYNKAMSWMMLNDSV